MSRKVFPILFILIFLCSGCLSGNIVDNKYVTNCVGNLTPCKTNTYYLGTPTYQWAGGYFSNLTANNLNLYNNNTVVSRDGAGNMIFTDAVSGTKTLAQLTVGSGGNLTGGGTLSYIPIWTSPSTLGDSPAFYSAGAFDMGGMAMSDVGLINGSNVTNMVAGGGAPTRLAYFDGAQSIGDTSMYFDVPNNRYGVGTVAPQLMLHLHDGGGPNGIQLSYTIGTLYSNITSDVFGFLRLMPSGLRVGINDLTPLYPLDVTGTIHSTGDVAADQDINATNDLNAGNDLEVTDDADIGGDLAVVGTANATRYTSYIATGTAPFTVASTTNVTNLNADMLDGLHSTDFALAGVGGGNVTTGGGTATYIPKYTSATNIENADLVDTGHGITTTTNITATTFTSTIGGGTPPFTVSSGAWVGNLNVDQVDGLEGNDLLLVDGSHTLTGNLSVAAGITIDGVDISTLGAGYANTFTISPSGANYTTIQAALTAQPTANALFLVYPGTYTNDTINFTANGQSVIGMGTYAKQIVTSASASVVNFAAYTGCSLRNMTVRITAATSAIATVNGSTGTIFLYDTAVEMTNSNVVTAAQPACIKTTGAATVTFINGFLNYTNNVATTAGAGIKAAVDPGAGSTTTFRRAALTLAGAGASALMIPIYQTNNCTTEFYRCRIVVTDLDTSAAIGFSWIDGGSGTGELYSNTCHVTCGAGAGQEADGLIATGTRSIRSMYNYIALTGNTQYPFQVDSGATIISEFDDIVSTGASLASGTGVLKYINSISDGNLKVSGNISVGQNITMAAGMTVDGVDVSGLVKSGYGADAGASDTYTCNVTGVTSYTTGLVIYFKANTANTGAATLNVNSLGAKALKINGGSADPSDNWIIANEIVHCIYDGTNLQVMNPDATP